MTASIVVRNLIKSYGKVRAVDDVSFEVRKGEIFGLIGPDGAGKTTILRVLVTLLDADDGEVLFQERPVRDHAEFVRSRIGYMPQRFSLYKDLTVEQNLRFYGDLFRIPGDLQNERMEASFRFSRLGPYRRRSAGALSGGMKQKLALSCVLMHEPDVVVMDEPTFGVDPVSRGEFWEIIGSLASRGVSVLVTTAYMDEARLCNRVGLIHQGRILAMDAPDKLIQKFGHPIYRVLADDPYGLYIRMQGTDFKGHMQVFGDGVVVVDRERLGRAALIAELRSSSIQAESVRKVEPNLENLFLELIR